MTKPIYKVCTAEAFAASKSEARFKGSLDDRRDGFIHLSAAHQLAATLAKYYAGQSGLVLLAFAPDKLPGLKWEVSRGDDLFPHVYDEALDLAALLWAEPLSVGPDGTHVLPEIVAA